MTTCASACATVSIDMHGTNNLCCGQTDPDLNYAEMGNFPLKGWKGKSKPKDFTAHHYVFTEIGLRIIVKHSVNCALIIRWFQSLHSLSVETGAMSISWISTSANSLQKHMKWNFLSTSYIADNSTRRSTEAMVFKCAIWRK